MIIYKKFTFDAAHYLPLVPANHKCGRMHGHTYQLTVYISGKPDVQTGWIMDFTDLKHHVKPLVEVLDHHLLNEIPGLENPTSENLSVWIWQKLKPVLPGLTKIELNETPGTGVIYEG